MKAIALLPLLLTGIFVRPVLSTSLINQIPVGDSNTIVHVMDGAVKEWPASRFETDNETNIQYAIDNDAKNLYIALNIPDSRMQFKMMRTGMSTYFDIKAKKKESRGVEFPEKNEEADAALKTMQSSRSSQSLHDEEGKQKKPDLKAIRKMLALNLVELKLFGFNKDDLDQQLMLPNSINIAFSWDTAEVMHLEYVVPLALLEDAGSLDKKEISIGWNLHAFEKPKTPGEQAAPTDGGGYGGGGFNGSGRRAYNPNAAGRRGGGNRSLNTPEDMQRMMEAQRFWTKYTVVIPVAKKAF